MSPSPYPQSLIHPRNIGRHLIACTLRWRPFFRQEIGRLLPHEILSAVSGTYPLETSTRNAVTLAIFSAPHAKDKS